MMIQFKPKDFLNKFKVVASAAPPKSTRATLQNKVKIVADKTSGVLLTATDLAHGICCRAEATVIENGGVLVPATEFRKLLESAKNEQVTLESVPVTLKTGKTQKTVYKPILSWGQNRFEFDACDPDDYPNIAEFKEASYYKMDPYELASLLEHTVFAAADGKVHNSGGVFTGVWLEDEGKRITAVATDGRHLAVQGGQGICVGQHRFGWKVERPESRMTYPIIPTPSVKTLLKALREKSIQYPPLIKLAFLATKEKDPAKTLLLLSAADVTFCSQLVDVKTAQWKFIVKDAGSTSEAVVQSGQLLAAIKCAGIVSSSRHSRLCLIFERNKLTVRGYKKDESSAELAIAMKYGGEKMEFELDRDCFVSMLQAVSGDIWMYLPQEPDDTLKVMANDKKLTYVIMTMKPM